MARLIFPFTLHIEGEANSDQKTQEVRDTQQLSQALKESLDLTQPSAEENLVEGVLEGERMRVGDTMVYGTQS
jgi:hypothetical protein